MKNYPIFKVLFINLFLLIFLLFVIELIFGYWFKNKLDLKLTAERNIERVYKFDFELHKGTSLYKRNNLAFRVGKKEVKPINIDIVFSGGSTTNQKFLNYEETIVGILNSKKSSKNIVNAGIDGMSIIGHLNSFENWFDKIKNLNPKYYIFYIGINDQNIIKKNSKPRAIDFLEENSQQENIIEYLQSNSFFYTKYRVLKTSLYLKFKFNKFANIVNENTKVYGERNNDSFIRYEKFNYDEIETPLINKIYLKYLEELTNKVLKRGSKVIYITQISGTGINKDLYIISETIINHCNEKKLHCINLAKNANLQYEDFYDWTHLNKQGSTKAANFIYENLLNNIFKN